MEPSLISELRSNFSASETDKEHFYRCWSRTSCPNCLDAEGCSWCPYLVGADEQDVKSWSCVPNPYKIPFLAPAYDKHTCPAWQEQWEIRTRPLGCNVSSVTTLTATVSIVGSFVVLLLSFLILLAALRIRVYARKKAWRFPWRAGPARTRDREQEPLLYSQVVGQGAE
ncbi:unnamed protein product [Clonostachys rosea]|uniref:PSI domain-containing protein n=1 Tax=Bionectria ochroleuca TaxID=29856 RepID=A0ABY6U9L6_BIOOC|nr:unnamed protein product [Clonostachys rosea]